MSHTSDESYETFGLVPSVVLIVAAFLVAILPLAFQIGVLAL
ncbi:MAG: hypothetical protein ACK4L8_10490 [Nitrincola lacisaponensis]|uniref:Uncharacterized protein n=1 Tax=Nitrincola lacisaponensis TaxID=267850 RepID=A0A063Y4X4_9GAMM|nr:hypothetical protein [Nitrincola lacisaponensis]KDE41373.1 hypothetical protein ADINL_0053 [Nitrincola lacisaponensis]